MINNIVKHFPISDNLANVNFKLPKTVYTTEEVDALIAGAVAKAREIDEASMKKHNECHGFLGLQAPGSNIDDCANVLLSRGLKISLYVALH